MMNLVAELARYGIRKKDVYEYLSITEKTLANKLDGTTSFSVSEAFRIRDHFLPGYSIEYLFADGSPIEAG